MVISTTEVAFLRGHLLFVPGMQRAGVFTCFRKVLCHHPVWDELSWQDSLFGKNRPEGSASLVCFGTGRHCYALRTLSLGDACFNPLSCPHPGPMGYPTRTA